MKRDKLRTVKTTPIKRRVVSENERNRVLLYSNTKICGEGPSFRWETEGIN